MQNTRLCCYSAVSSDPATNEMIFNALHAHLGCPPPQFVIVHTSLMDTERKPNTYLVSQGSPTITPSNHPHPCGTGCCCASHIQTSEDSHTPPNICHKHPCFVYLQAWQIKQLISGREDVFYLVHSELLFSNFPLICFLCNPFCHSLLKNRYFKSLACFWSCLKHLVGRKKSGSGIQKVEFGTETQKDLLLCLWQVHRTPSLCVKQQDIWRVRTC